MAMRVSQGGYEVPYEKLVNRLPHILADLREAFHTLAHVWVFDNDDLRRPFRLLAVSEKGKMVQLHRPAPVWLRPLLPSNFSK
jgi:predicted ABC-type ATPase